MRPALLLLVALTCACSSQKPDPGDAAVNDSSADAIDAPPADAAWSCVPTGGACSEGPACGGGCCAEGEHCDNGTCMCGEEAACTGGDTCQTGGPITVSVCGQICCGSPQHPCPI